MLTTSVQLLQTKTKTTLQNFSPKLLSTSQTPFFKNSSSAKRIRNFSLMRNNFKVRGPTSTKKQLDEPRKNEQLQQRQIFLNQGEKCWRRRQHKQNERCVFFSHGGRQGAVYSGTVAADEDALAWWLFVRTRWLVTKLVRS
ncbi:hypothetical protein QL285_036059 [Trifolium repens]|nr:hypothetical protein QL285_036059 [Trifolium repens]